MTDKQHNFVLTAASSVADRNRMRVLFIDPAFRSTAWRMIMGENAWALATEHLPRDATPRVRRWFDDPEIHVEYEVDGWDAVLRMPGMMREAAGRFCATSIFNLSRLSGMTSQSSSVS
jgi:hypothetical protein